MTLPAGTRLGVYQVLAPLGAGGMGEVYRARDERLGRDVAVKILPEELGKDPVALARFQEEARALAALSHPNILAIHDVGAEAGVPFTATELLEGETLRQRLGPGTPLPHRKAVEYAKEIARGLAAAHEKGIVHRDLKPDNIFITRDGRVKILDFGLARRAQGRSTPQEAQVPTVPLAIEDGFIWGTLGYLAPEQVRGLPADQRSDIFAFGTILYEMLSGRTAFRRDTGAETITATLREDPEDLTRTHPEVPAALERIARHCMEKSPEERFQSASDIAFDLESLSTHSGPALHEAHPGRRRLLPALIVALVLACAAVALLLWRRPTTVPKAAAGSKRIAVLPFENLGSPEDDYFADGIADELRGKLTSLPGLEVIARASSNEYRKTKKKPRVIGRELDVEYLLTGTVRWDKRAGQDSRVQVSPELIAASTAASMWAQPFDAAVTDVFRVQGEIATRVAEALEVALGKAEKKRLGERPTESLEAYEAFLRGEEAGNSLGTNDPARLRAAAAHYEKAVALDPAFVQAWGKLSGAHAALYANSGPTPEGAEKAKQAADKAVALAPDRPEGYRAMANYLRVVKEDPAGALADAERAVRLGPGNASSLASLALVEQALGHWDEALGHLKEAQRLDPRVAATARRLGTLLLWLRRYPEAREALDRGLVLMPADLNMIEHKAMVSLAEGNLAAAREALRASAKDVDGAALAAFTARYWDLVWVLDDDLGQVLLRLPPSGFDNNQAQWAICLAQAYAVRGDRANLQKYAEIARAAFEQRLRDVPQNAQLHSQHGLALAYLGRNEEAVREAQRAVELVPISKGAFNGAYYQHQLVRVLILTGAHQKAVDELEKLLKIPYYLSPGWLRIDPNFEPLRNNAQFQEVLSR